MGCDPPHALDDIQRSHETVVFLSMSNYYRWQFGWFPPPVATFYLFIPRQKFIFACKIPWPS